MSTFLRDFLGFLVERRKLWMLPMLLVILLLGGVMALAELTPAGPFIYTLF